jgi:hypothetical protein
MDGKWGGVVFFHGDLLLGLWAMKRISYGWRFSYRYGVTPAAPLEHAL